MPFAPNAWEDLLKLDTLHAFLQANGVFERLRQDEFWEDSEAGFLPQFLKQTRGQYDVQFHRYAKHLAKVVPAKERWRFGL